jgi:hypothetical protein
MVMSCLQGELRDSAPQTSLENCKSNTSWMLHYKYNSETSLKRQSTWQAELDLYLAPGMMAVTNETMELLKCVDMCCRCKHVCVRQTYLVI